MTAFHSPIQKAKTMTELAFDMSRHGRHDDAAAQMKRAAQVMADHALAMQALAKRRAIGNTEPMYHPNKPRRPMNGGYNSGAD